MRKQVVIVGGGPAGTATAIALRNRGIGVLLIEKSNYDAARLGEHLLSDARPLLAELGVLDDVAAGGHLPSPGVQSAWGSAVMEGKSYIFSPYGDAWNLSRPSFDAALAQQSETRGAVVFRGAWLRTFERVGCKWRLELQQGASRIRCGADFLVDATGRTAQVARSLGCRRLRFDQLLAVVGFHSRPAAGARAASTVLIEAQPDGWWYGMPLPEGGTAVAMMTDADLLRGLGHRPMGIWRRKLQQSTHLKEYLGRGKLEPSVHVCSARSELLTSTVGPGWLAVGDAASSFDPLSSSGILNGLAGGIKAAKAIESHFGGDCESLVRYQSDVRLAFNEFLTLRAQFYRMENRWPDSLFWRRRQRSMSSETPVTLNPSIQIRARRGVSSQIWQSSLDQTVPGLDGVLLLRLAQESQPAHCLISQFKSSSGSLHGDRDLIVAVQSLAEGGLLHLT